MHGSGWRQPQPVLLGSQGAVRGQPTSAASHPACPPSQAVSKDERRGAPIFAVIDAPSKKIKDKGYLWIEARCAALRCAVLAA